MSREKLLEIINVKQYFEINRNNFINIKEYKLWKNKE